MDTVEVRLRKVPVVIIAKAKAAATIRGISMDQYLTEILSKALKDGKKRAS